MTNLALSTATSLQSLSQWISLIDTNLTNSQRTGYKETRISLAAGEVDNLGSTPGVTNINMVIPSTTLKVNATSINEYEQGQLLQTGGVSEFALQGRGFFVVEDANSGERFATRDGTFHFDTNGYLVTEEGLRVLTTGQDYFKIPVSESFSVDSYGKSVINDSATGTAGTVFNPAGTRDLSTSRYGTRQLLVIQTPDSYKLHYSKYGFTKFDLGEYLPVNIENNFSQVMDGINPYLSDRIDSVAGNYTNMAQYFKHDRVNGLVKMDLSQGKQVQAEISAHKFTEFTASMDVNFEGNFTNGSFGFIVGEKQRNSHSGKELRIKLGSLVGFNPGDSLTITQGSNSFVTTVTAIDPTTNEIVLTSSLPPTFSSTGTFNITDTTTSTTVKSISYNNVSDFGGATFAGISNGNLVLKNSVIGINVSTPIAAIVNDAFGGAATAANTYKLMVTVKGGNLAITFTNSAGVQVTRSVAFPQALAEGKYVSVGTDFTNTPVMANTLANINRLTVVEASKSDYFNMIDYAGPEKYRQSVGSAAKGYLDADIYQQEGQADRMGTVVRQGYLEASTSTMADQLPMLGNTQKVFSAIAKIINVANSNNDDVNSLIR